MKGKFTPLNKSYAIELAKKYNLVQGCFGSELGHFDDDDTDVKLLLRNQVFISQSSLVTIKKMFTKMEHCIVDLGLKN